METSAPRLTRNQRAKWALRLQTPNPDRSDVGQELPKTAEVLNRPAQSVEEAARRVVALVQALQEERLVVEVPVEPRPESPDHTPVDLAADATLPLKLIDGPFGANVAVFSSVQELASFDPGARPMTMSAQRVAVIADLAGGSGGLVVNPRSEREATIPRSAALALAAGGEWLPAWEDPSMTQELLEGAQAADPNIVGVKISPVAGASSVPGQSASSDSSGNRWEGAVRVEVQVAVTQSRGAAGISSVAGADRRFLAAALETITSNERLKESSPHIEVVPIPVYGV